MLPSNPALFDKQQGGLWDWQDAGTESILVHRPSARLTAESGLTQLQRLHAATNSHHVPSGPLPPPPRPTSANTRRRRVPPKTRKVAIISKVKSVETLPKSTPKDGTSKATRKPENPIAGLRENRTLRRDEIQPLLQNSPSLTSSNLDPFSVLSEHLDSTQKGLLSFYVGPYWSTAQPFAPTLRPHPRITSLQQAMNCPVMLRVVLGRAAFHLISLNKDISPTERNRLEVAGLRQRVQAVTTLKQRLAHLNRSVEDKDDLLTSTICMATFEYRHGPPESSNVHFAACRNLMKLTGGISRIQDKLMERQALWFESVYAKSEMSFVFDPSDASVRAAQLAEFLKETATVWRNRTQKKLTSTASKSPAYIQPNTRLFHFLSRDSRQKGRAWHYDDYSEAAAQLTCLMIFVRTILDTTKAPGVVQTYTKNLQRLLAEQHLDHSVSVVNLLWLMLTDTSVAEVDSSERKWHVAGLMNAVKYLAAQWQMRLKAWLLGLVGGEAFQQEFKVDLFAFSYDAGAGS